jgi:2-methylcitrate dehydratase PrpD
VQAAINLRRTRLKSHEEIDRIIVSVPERLLDTLFIDRPVRGYGGKFSVRYPVAVALIDGDLTIDSFSDETLARRDVQDMMNRIEVVIKAGAGLDRKERHHTPMRVHCRDGRVLDEDPPEHPRGMRKNRMAGEEIVAKYDSCAGRILTSEQVQRSIAAYSKLESLSVRELIDAVVIA